ncbi:hypothetical protein MRX96_029179 [Rhipicephalus microplus]
MDATTTPTGCINTQLVTGSAFGVNLEEPFIGETRRRLHVLRGRDRSHGSTRGAADKVALFLMLTDKRAKTTPSPCEYCGVTPDY